MVMNVTHTNSDADARGEIWLFLVRLLLLVAQRDALRADLVIL
jgi:hypothetical protein